MRQQSCFEWNTPDCDVDGSKYPGSDLPSNSLLSDFSYLKFHMPSFSPFQYAPEAECIPLLPERFMFPSAVLWFECCMIVLLTANL